MTKLVALVSSLLLVAAGVACGSDDSGGGSNPGGPNSGGSAGGGAGGQQQTSCNVQACQGCVDAHGDDLTPCMSACAGCDDGSGAGGSDVGSAGAGGGASAGKDIGESCRYDGECASHDCPFSLSYCTKGCTDFAECPAFWDCKVAGASGQKVCQK